MADTIKYVRCFCINALTNKTFWLLPLSFIWCLSIHINAAVINRQVSTNHERASLTLGTQWLIPVPARVYHDQSGVCHNCGTDYCPHWSSEGLTSDFGLFNPYLKRKVLEEAPGCQYPTDCQPPAGCSQSGERITGTNFLAIDSKSLRKHHARALLMPDNTIYNYCIENEYSLRKFINYRLVDFQAPDLTTFCFSEMPMPESLVVYTNDDFLGDHDCGVYPPRDNKQLTARPLETLLAFDSESFPVSDVIRGENDGELSRETGDIQFLDGGAKYSNVITVGSGKELLRLLPVHENTVIILRSDVFDSGSGGFDHGTAVNNIQPAHPDRFSSQSSTTRSSHPERLQDTDSYPKNVGLRDTVFTISSEDIFDPPHRHSSSRRFGLINLVDSSATLMVIGQGEGVKLKLDIEDMDILQNKSLFGLRGTVQLYNIDIEASLPEGSRLFQVDHHLQLYRSSIHLHTVGKLFTGSGLVTASRSLLHENGSSPATRDRDDCLMLRSCRSEIILSDWQTSPDALIAMNGNYSYYGDYLDRAELLLPEKPERYRQSMINDSPLLCNELASQALIPSNWFSQLSTVSSGLREVLCPDITPPMNYNRVFRRGKTVPAAQWQAGSCPSDCGRFVDTTMNAEAEKECLDSRSALVNQITTHRFPESSSSPATPASTSNGIIVEKAGKIVSVLLGMGVSMAIIIYCMKMAK